jgi:aryl-alcohol dehydrogenase-like predicted oxidoreductase
MKSYLLGKSGLRVSELALGAMSPTIQQSIAGGVEVHRK